jgi:uncharacterized protein YggT (Ycf19 family)
MVRAESDIMHSLTDADTHERAGSRAALLGRVGQVVDYLFGVLYVLLLVRFALEFFGARSGAGFSQIIRDLTDVFYAPFRGIFATTIIDTGHFVWPLVVAILGYMLLHAGIRGLLHLLARV